MICIGDSVYRKKEFKNTYGWWDKIGRLGPFKVINITDKNIFIKNNNGQEDCWNIDRFEVKNSYIRMTLDQARG